MFYKVIAAGNLCRYCNRMGEFMESHATQISNKDIA